MGDIHYGVVKGAGSIQRVRAYLPSNYYVSSQDGNDIHICGEDIAGWTFADYIVPRLASGMLIVTETNENGDAIK